MPLLLERIELRLHEWTSELDLAVPRAAEHDPDPEVYHDCRVLCRRLRTGLALVGAYETSVAAKEVKVLDRGLRALASSLGPIRDADVLEAHLVAAARPEGIDPDCVREWREAVRLLRENLQQSRAKAHSRLVRVEELSELFVARVRSGIAALAIPAAAQEPVEETISGWTAQFVRQARTTIASDRSEEWHALRIDGKRLRYGLELTQEARSDRHAQLVAIQQVLGEAHDHRVWERLCTDVRRSLSRRGSDVILRAGLESVASWEACSARALEQSVARKWVEIESHFLDARTERLLAEDEPPAEEGRPARSDAGGGAEVPATARDRGVIEE